MSEGSAVVIRDARVITDTWHLVRDVEVHVPPEGGVILPLAVWLADSPRWSQRPATGVWLASDHDPVLLEPWLSTLPLIAIDFPRFTDGRGYSSAFLLRNRLGFRGELRAVGDVLVDQIWYLARVGFNAFALRADQDAQVALAQLTVFSERYQGSTDQPVPAFRRRERQWPDGTRTQGVS